jgi:hypothetical protein
LDKELAMKTQAILLGVALSLLAASGCGVCHALLYEPFGPNSLCDVTNGSARGVGGECGETCGGPCPRPGLGHRVHRETCDSCGDPGGDSCGDPCGAVCCHRGRHCGPLTWVFSLFHCCTFPFSGCGEQYWGDWYGDPPDCSDPCDQCGNYAGRGKPAHGSVEGVVMPEAPARGTGRGCANCGNPTEARRPSSSTQSGSKAASLYAPRIISQTDRVLKPAQGEPTPRLARQPKQPTQQD